MARYMRTDLGAGHSRLKPPVVVDEGIVYPPIHGFLFPLVTSQRRKHRSFLRPPTVVAAVVPVVFTARPVDVTLAPTLRQPRRTMAGVRPPRFVGAGIVFRPVQTHLAPSRRGHATARLLPPTVIAAVTQTYTGPVAHLAKRIPRRSVRSTWVFPIVVFRQQAFGWIAIQLVRTPRIPVRSTLKLPAAVSAAVVVYSGPQVTLAYSRRGRGRWLLRPPVLRQPAPPLRVTLTRTRPRPVTTVLSPPTVIDRRPQTVYLATSLAYSRRGTPKSRLAPPTVIDRRVYFGPAVTLTYSRRGNPRSRLAAPAVINTDRYFGPAVTLAYSLRGKAKPRLLPPTVVGLPPFRGLQTTLVAVRTRTEQPAHRTMAGVRPPRFVAVEAAVVHKPVRWLAYSRRGHATARLLPPTVVATPQPVLVPIRVTLTQVSLRRRGALSDLPVVVYAPPDEFGGILQSLAPSRRGTAKSKLGTPQVVARAVYYGPQVTLAPQRRGQPKSVLRKPVVIDLRPQTRFISVNLTYSRRGRPIWFLRKPVLAAPRAFRPVKTTLVRLDLRRRRPTYRLRPPTRVAPVLARRILTELAYSRRGRPVYKLRPPVVVRIPENRRTRVTLVRNQPRPTVALVRPPAAVRTAALYPIRVTLAPQPRPQTMSRLLPPAVIQVFGETPFRTTLVRVRPQPTVAVLRAPTVVFQQPEITTLTVSLAYSLRGRPVYRLQPPAVVFPPPHARPTQVTLVTIRPPKRYWLLIPPAVVTTFIPPAGDVCGTDEPAADDCGTDTPTSDDVCGTDESADGMAGSDSPESRIVGSDTAVGDACGTDEQST